MRPDDINTRAYQYATANVSQLRQICDPLFQTPIKVFAYFRFFNDGRYLYLCNDLEWVKFCLQNVHNNEDTSLGKEIGHVPEDGYHCYLWPTTKTDYLMSALYEFNIWHGLSIFKQTGDTIELWGFATDRQTDGMENFYLENVHVLKDFTAAFNIHGANMIAPKPRHLAIYRDFKVLPRLDEYDQAIIDRYIKATPIDQCPIITDTGERFLSKRELQCLHALASGRPTKLIAQQLCLSRRTIEYHIHSMRKKLGGADKAQMIKVYKESVFHWL